jgi:hypothetical protein
MEAKINFDSIGRLIMSENKTTATSAKTDTLHRHDGWGPYQPHEVLAEYVTEEVMIYGGPRSHPDPKLISSELMEEFDLFRSRELSPLMEKLEAELRANYTVEQVKDILGKVRAGAYHSGRRWYRNGAK